MKILLLLSCLSLGAFADSGLSSGGELNRWFEGVAKGVNSKRQPCEVSLTTAQLPNNILNRLIVGTSSKSIQFVDNGTIEKLEETSESLKMQLFYPSHAEYMPKIRIWLDVSVVPTGKSVKVTETIYKLFGYKSTTQTNCLIPN